MKKLLFVISLAVMLAGCAGWTINGIPAEKFKHATAAEYVKLGSGMVASHLAHFAGHVVYCEVAGLDWHLESWRYEVVDDPMTRGEAAMMGRSGFLAQLAGGVALKFWGPTDSFFVTGYHAGSLIEIAGYPLTQGKYSDITMINHDSNAVVELGIYTASAAYLLDVKRSKK